LALELRLNDVLPFSELTEFLLDDAGVTDGVRRSTGPGLPLDDLLPPDEFFLACRLALR
jgi:hypothetical protein